MVGEVWSVPRPLPNHQATPATAPHWEHARCAGVGGGARPGALMSFAPFGTTFSSTWLGRGSRLTLIVGWPGGPLRGPSGIPFLHQGQQLAGGTCTPQGMPYGRGHSHPDVGHAASAARPAAGWPSWAQHPDNLSDTKKDHASLSIQGEEASTHTYTGTPKTTRAATSPCKTARDTTDPYSPRACPSGPRIRE